MMIIERLPVESGQEHDSSELNTIQYVALRARLRLVDGEWSYLSRLSQSMAARIVIAQGEIDLNITKDSLDSQISKVMGQARANFFYVFDQRQGHPGDLYMTDILERVSVAPQYVDKSALEIWSLWDKKKPIKEQVTVIINLELNDQQMYYLLTRALEYKSFIKPDKKLLEDWTIKHEELSVVFKPKRIDNKNSQAQLALLLHNYYRLTKRNKDVKVFPKIGLEKDLFDAIVRSFEFETDVERFLRAIWR